MDKSSSRMGLSGEDRLLGFCSSCGLYTRNTAYISCLVSMVETCGLDKSSWCCLKTKITQHGEAIQKPTSVPGLFLIVSHSNFTFVVGIWKTKLGDHNVGVF